MVMAVLAELWETVALREYLVSVYAEWTFFSVDKLSKILLSIEQSTVSCETNDLFDFGIIEIVKSFK